MEDSESCYGPGSVAGAVIGTFLATCLIVAVGAFLYRQWRRHKGKHLVLVTDPEIVEEAYAFDNPCFKDVTPAVLRGLERPAYLATRSETTTSTTQAGAPSAAAKDAARWTTPWSNLGRAEKRRTLDDSCLGPKSGRVSVVGLRSRDFTGLGFNVCGNMREGIFVKDLLHRGPASESGRIHPGDRISSVKISFRSMVYEDALTILSYASPYDVELEVESGGSISHKPSTLLKKSVSPSPAHICHPLYRSQSIPDLSQQQQQQQLQHQQHHHHHHQQQQQSGSWRSVAARRLFAADPSDSASSHYSTTNSTAKPSAKSNPAGQGQEQRRHEDAANTTAMHHCGPQQQQQQQQPKFGIKVLPALDGTVHRAENQNEHNTNLERRHSRKLEFAEQRHSGSGSCNVGLGAEAADRTLDRSRLVGERSRRAGGSPAGEKRIVRVTDGFGIDVTDRPEESATDKKDASKVVMPSEVPTEVHNAAIAARRNRKSSGTELPVQKPEQQLSDSPQPSQEIVDSNGTKSPQKGKRKAPAPPLKIILNEVHSDDKIFENERTIDNITDYSDLDQLTTDSISDETAAKEEEEQKSSDSTGAEMKLLQKRSKRISSNSRNSESDTDSEIPNSFTTIELNPADITVHHTPVPEAKANDDDDDDVDDVYRKAASLGDLSKYENKVSTTTLERAQSLDMTDTSSKKRKAPMPPPEDIHESTEDLTKLDQIGTFDCRKLKKSNKWGTLEDAIWSGSESEPLDNKVSTTRKKSDGSSGGTLERSKSNVEIKTNKDETSDESSLERLNVSDGALETSLQLYNLPLSKKLTQDFIRAERLFDPEEDNALARIVNDGEIIKLPTAGQLDADFRKAHPLPEDDDDLVKSSESVKTSEAADSFKKAIMYFDMHAKSSPASHEIKVSLPDPPEELYAGKKEILEKPMSKVTLNFSCPSCDHHHGHHSVNCSKSKPEDSEISYHQTIKVEDSKVQLKRVEEPLANRVTHSDRFETHFAKPIINIPDDILKDSAEDDEDEKAYEFESTVTINNKNLSPSPIADKHNISNVSVSSGENSEDSGLVHESIEFNAGGANNKNLTTPSHEIHPKMTYITEIKVSPSNHESADLEDDDNAVSDNEEIVSIMQNSKNVLEASPSSTVTTLNVTSNGKLPGGKKPPVPPRRSDAARFVPRNSITPDKQIVYVSEYKSPSTKEPEVVSGRKFEDWVFFEDKWQG